MRTHEKIGIAFVAVVLALVVSPAIPYSEAGEARKITSSVENPSISNTIKTVMIAGHENPQFVPNVVHLKIGDSIRFINQDGQEGGLAHQVISIEENGIPDGEFSATLQNSGDTYIEKFSKSGIYHFTDSTYTQMHAILVVS